MASRCSLLIRRREELGLSQEQLPARIRTDRTTVGRIERGETTPQPHTRQRLSQALQVSPEHLADLLTTDSSRQAVPPPAPANPGSVVADIHATGVIDMYRRNLLRLLGVAATMSLLPHDELGAVERVRRSADPDQLRLLTTSLWQTYGLATNKQLIYPLVEEQLRTLITAIGEARTEAERRTLCVNASELFQLAGEILFDGNFYTEALAFYSHAASAAKEGGAYDQWACALVRHGFVSIYDHQYQQAATILDAAVRIAGRGDSQLPTRHWVAVVRAQASAAINDLTGCEAALETAQQITGQRNMMIPGGWLRFDGSRLDEERGTCFLTLGESDRAAEALACALEHTGSPRHRGSLLTDLASVGVHRRDPDEVLVHAHAALDLAEQALSPGYVGRKLRTLRAQLQPMRADSRIAALHDRISGVLKAA